MFSNLSVDLDQLPQMAPATLLAVERRYAWVGGGVVVLWSGLLLAGYFFWSGLTTRDAALRVIESQGSWLPLVILAMLLLASYVIAARRRIRYGLREHDFYLEEGLFYRTQTVQPLRRLQHVSLHQGPLEKALGLASLRVFSAGSGLSTFSVPGLNAELAAKLRDQALAYQLDE